jgi:hypothetical protein
MATNIVYTGQYNPYALVQQAGSRRRRRTHKRRTPKYKTHKHPKRHHIRTKRRLN